MQQYLFATLSTNLQSGRWPFSSEAQPGKASHMEAYPFKTSCGPLLVVLFDSQFRIATVPEVFGDTSFVTHQQLLCPEPVQ